MASIDPRTGKPGLALAVAALLTGTAAADTLVVRSAGPSAAAYPPGRKLPATAQLKLAARDIVVLLDERGTRTLTGPGLFRANAARAADNRPSVLAALTSERSDRRVRIGAVRQIEGVTDVRPDIWMVDVAKAGAVCVVAPRGVTLWRADSSRAAQGSVVQVGGTGSAQLSWAPGQSSQPWPAAVGIVPGGRYRIAHGAAAAIEVRMQIVGAPPAALTDVAGVLIRNGCATQLDQVVATASAAGAAGS